MMFTATALSAFIHTAARDLRADVQSAKYTDTADHASTGYWLCSDYFNTLFDL